MACGACERRCYWLAEKLDLTCELVRGALWAGIVLGTVVGLWVVAR